MRIAGRRARAADGVATLKMRTAQARLDPGAAQGGRASQAEAEARRTARDILKPNLSRRLFLLIIGAMLPLVAILFFNLYEIKASRERGVHAEAFRMGQVAALEIQRIIDGFQSTLSVIAAAPAVQNHDVRLCNEYMGRVGAQIPQFASVGVLDKDGTVWCRQTPKGIGLSLKDTDYFQGAMSTGKLYVGHFRKGRITGADVLPIAYAVRTEDGQVNGVVVGTLDLAWLDNRIRERNFARNSNLTIADREGTILARYPMPERFVGTRIPMEFQHLVHASQPGTLELTSQDGTRRVLSYFPPEGENRLLYVSAGFSTQDEYASIRRATEFGIAVTLLVLLATTAIAWMTSKYAIEAPVARLVDTVAAWQADETVRTGMTARDGEFGVVGQAIDDFMNRLDAAREQRRLDEQQRDLLVGELDHRVKNLLATVQSVARQTFRSNDGNKTAIEAFNNRLRAIGDAHSLLMAGKWHSAGFADLVAQAIRPFESRDEPHFDMAGPDFDIQSRAALSISMALHELCTNAVKYGALSTDRGRITIRWNIDRSGPEPRFVLRWTEEDGPPVAAPGRGGFGTSMIDRALTHQLDGEVTMDYRPQGLVCMVTAPLRSISVDADDTAADAV